MTGERRKRGSVLTVLVHRLLVGGGAAGMALGVFLILPLIQTIKSDRAGDRLVRNVDTVAAEPPPPPPEEPEEEEPEPEEEPPPELEEDTQELLDLAQLEQALNPGFQSDWLAGDFAVDLGSISGAREEAEELFSLADLDQTPRPVYQPSPVMSAKVRRQAPGTVNLLFIVDKNGRVQSPRVGSSSDSVFEGPALDAIKQWKFEPGKRQGKPVSFRMKVPITFPKE